MGDAVKSLLSVHSIEVQSRLSVLSNSKLSPSTTPNADPHSTASHSSNKVKQTGKPTSTAKVTHTPQAGKAGGGGVSGGVIAAIVIIILLAAAGAGFLFWRRRRQQNVRTRSGLWLESRSVYEAYSKPPGDSAPSRDSGYVFNGSGRNGVPAEPRPLSVAPPPPAKEKPSEPSNIETASLSRDPLPPSPVHAPRPRTPEPSADPYAQVQGMLAHPHHIRPDSGPMILYSTPRQDDYYGGDKAQPNVLQLPAVSTQSVVGASASSFPQPNTPTSLKHAPPMPVPVPEPVPTPPSPTTPATPQNRSPSIQSRVSSPAPPIFQTAPSSPAVPTMPPTVVSNSNDNRNLYFVIRTYVPTMLDELRVSVGDRVVVVNKFDDGWAYCEKVDDPDGAAGVIPLECLDRSSNLSPRSAISPVPSLTSDPRLSNTRFSSFHVDFDPANANRV